MLFWPGIMGEFMSYLPLTVIMALSGSLFVALVINPVLSSMFQTAKPSKINDDDGEPDVKGRPLVLRMYFRLLSFSLNHRFITVVVALILFGSSIATFALFGAGVEFFPETDPDWGEINIKAPVGTNLDASDEIVRKVEALVSGYPDIRQRHHHGRRQRRRHPCQPYRS